MSNLPPSRPRVPQSLSAMSKLEMEEKIRGYKYVLFKLHQEMASKDEEIARLNKLVDRLTKQGGKAA